MATTKTELARDILVNLMLKSGVREWESADAQENIANAAVNLADFIWFYTNGNPNMAVTATFREQIGTTKTWKSSGGDAAMTPTSLANGSYYEGAKLDLGATRAQVYAVWLDLEIAATPTAGNTVDVWMNGSSSGTAGTDNGGGATGTDAAYTGYSSNAAAAVKQLAQVGSGVVTAQATATVQKRIFVGYYAPQSRYVSPIILNGSGAAFHSTITNFQLRLEPVEFTAE